MSILDTIIGNSSKFNTSFEDRGPRILSQEHDVNKIDFGGESAINNASGRRPSGPWDEREYGISLAEAQRRYDAAQTPEARAKVIAELTARAIQRASLDVTNGRVSVMVAGKAPWHKLGVNVEAAVSSRDAARLANIDWLVEKLANYYMTEDGVRHVADGVFSIVRKDTGKMLGSVGSRYQAIQNVDGFGYLDKVLEKFGARYETAGAIHGGKKVWMQAILPNQRFAVNGVDCVEPYVIFTNSHDGTGAARCFATAQRVVCANTFRMAQAGRRDGISIPHMGDINKKVEAAQYALGLAVNNFDKFKHASQAMAKTPLVGGIKDFANDVLDSVLEMTAAEAVKGTDALLAAMKVTDSAKEMARKELDRQIERRSEILNDIIMRYDGEKNGVGGMRGTVWAGFNAVTESSDWGFRYKGSEDVRESRRFESVLSGEADELKQAAYSKASAMIA